MRLKYKGFITLAIILMIITLMPTSIFAETIPTLAAPNAVLIDYETGKVLFDKNAHMQVHPASTTKVMTAILTLENANLDDLVNIDYEPNVDGSSMFILEGESFTVRDLLQALLIRSANDSAKVLAIHIGGSEEKFVEMMNKRAKELRALNTNFVNPHGLTDPNHLTTAYDLALIARHAMSFDTFRDIVSMDMLILDATEQTPGDRIYRNTNKFLWATDRVHTMVYEGKYTTFKYDIIDGIKTGYTDKAKHCLISSGVKNDYRVISVVLGAENESELYSDSRSLIDYGHDNFKLVNLSVKDFSKLSINVKKGKDTTLDLAAKNNQLVVLPINKDLDDIVEVISIDEDIKAPISRGQTLGRVTYLDSGEPIAEIDLISKNDVEKQHPISKLKLPKSLVIFIVLFMIFRLFIAYLRFKRKRRKRFVYRKRSSLYLSSKKLYK